MDAILHYLQAMCVLINAFKLNFPKNALQTKIGPFFKNNFLKSAPYKQNPNTAFYYRFQFNIVKKYLLFLFFVASTKTT